eukprot:355749-Chlamydomonas_euryale.AAC.2
MKKAYVLMWSLLPAHISIDSVGYYRSWVSWQSRSHGTACVKMMDGLRFFWLLRAIQPLEVFGIASHCLVHAERAISNSAT